MSTLPDASHPRPTTPPDRLVEFRDGILVLIRGHPGVARKEYEVALNDLGGSGVDLVQVFFDVSDGHAGADRPATA